MFYRRNLPHWHPEGTLIFLTWCLHGAPRGPYEHHRVAGPIAKFAGIPSKGESVGDTESNLERGRRYFAAMERCLHREGEGPQWLVEPRIASIVHTSLHFGESKLGSYRLHAWVIMPNHVHVLLEPQAPVARITKSLKGYTARQANQVLGRTGEPFWQDETFDHWVRDEWSYRRIVRYIEWNPVAARLVNRPLEWPWSSAGRHTGTDAGGP